jgi:hypothetical protein
MNKQACFSAPSVRRFCGAARLAARRSALYIADP